MKRDKREIEDRDFEDREGPFDAEPGPQPAGTTLIGPIAAAYDELRFAAADMEKLTKLHSVAQERYRAAIGRFSQLAAGTVAPLAE